MPEDPNRTFPLHNSVMPGGRFLFSAVDFRGKRRPPPPLLPRPTPRGLGVVAPHVLGHHKPHPSRYTTRWARDTTQAEPPPPSPTTGAHKSPPPDSEGACGCTGSTARATAPSPGRPTPGVVKQDKSSGGSVDTTKTRSDPQRVRMSSGERPIGAANGQQTNTMASCHPPPPSGAYCAKGGAVTPRLTPCLIIASHGPKR